MSTRDIGLIGYGDVGWIGAWNHKFFSCVVQHGERRVEAMRESANTVRETGIAPVRGRSMPAGC